MQKDELAEFDPTAQVVSLGRPERVFATGPDWRVFGPWLSLGTGLALIALGAGIMVLFYTVMPAKERAQPVVPIVVHGLAGFCSLLGVILAALTRKMRLAYVYAVYPEVLAYLHDGTWSVIRWNEVQRYLGQSLTSPLFARLVLHDGSTIKLENNYLQPAPLNQEIERRVQAQLSGAAETFAIAPSDGRAQRVPTIADTFATAPSDRPAQRAPTTADTFATAPSDRPAQRAPRRPWIRPKYIPSALGIGGLALILLSVGIFQTQWRWLLWLVENPVKISSAELVKLQDPRELRNPMVSVRCDQLVDTGLEVVVTRRGTSHNESRFVLARVQDRWLIANVPLKHAGNELVGYLDVWGPRGGEAGGAGNAESITKITEKFPECKNALLPVQLDATYRARMDRISLLVFTGFLLACGLAMLAFAWRRFQGVRRVEVMADGLLWEDGAGQHQRRWDEVAAVTRKEAIINQIRRQTLLKVSFTSGRDLVFNHTMIEEYDDVVGQIQQQAAQAVLPRMRAELERDGHVQSGVLTVGRGGFALGRDFYGWGEVDFGVENGCLVVVTRGRPLSGRGRRSEALSEIPNYLALLQLMAEAGKAPAHASR